MLIKSIIIWNSVILLAWIALYYKNRRIELIKISVTYNYDTMDEIGGLTTLVQSRLLADEGARKTYHAQNLYVARKKHENSIRKILKNNKNVTEFFIFPCDNKI